MGDSLFRYRKLIPQGPRDVRTELSGFNVESAGLNALLGVAGGTQEVSAEEGTADLVTLEQMLRKKGLQKSDLVFSRGQWRSFADAPEFSDLCRTLVDTRALKGTLRAAVILLGALLAYVAYVAWRIHTGR